MPPYEAEENVEFKLVGWENKMTRKMFRASNLITNQNISRTLLNRYKKKMAGWEEDQGAGGDSTNGSEKSKF